jgi:catechol 2,3-dioxygenase-like lactoylglutathione lyase family enzyme
MGTVPFFSLQNLPAVLNNCQEKRGLSPFSEPASSPQQLRPRRSTALSSVPIHPKGEAEMEVQIGSLVEQFEKGKLSRRQLIQALAMLAGAAPAGASTLQQTSPAAPQPIPQAFEPTGWKTVALDHISFAVTDYRRSAAFYRDLMGWTIRSDNGTSQATLDINGLGEIIIRNRRDTTTASAASSTTSAAGQRPNRPPVTGVINHISWGIEPWDTQTVEAELKRRGLNPRPDMQGDNFKSYHVLDPDGWDLQISNQAKKA